MPDDLFLLYIALSGVGILEIMWTMVLIAHVAFMSSDALEAWPVREARRVSLALVAVGISLSARWHIDSGKGAFLPEYLVLIGIDLYLGAAIYSSYERLRRLRAYRGTGASRV